VRIASPRNRLGGLAALALAAASLGLGLSACGGGGDASTGSASNPQPFTLDLDWYVNPDHAGIYSALDQDYFKQVGLDVQPQVPSDPSAPIREVAAGRADLAVSYEPEVLLAEDKGLDVQAVAAIVDQPLTSLISLPNGGIEGAASLQGKTVGTAGIPYQSDYLQTILQTAGLPSSATEEVNVGLNLLPALIGGRVDAILGGFRNIEGVDLQQRGLSPRIVPVDQLGVPTYDELVLVANEDALDRDKDKIRAFIGALSRGTRTLRSSPDRAVEGLLQANPDLDAKLQRAALKVSLPLFFPPDHKPFGYQDPTAWDEFTGWMRDNHLLTKTPSAKGAFTNELLPGSGL
jgi:putative hydroxymethylpyrimidine transport system substrate-binding protein